MNYTIQQLNYFVALSTYGSFSKAADHCKVTQPTLSMQVKKLESQLGIELLDRSRQPVRFTALGQRVLEKAQEALAELREIDDLINASQQELSGEFNVGIIPTLAPYLVPEFLGAFMKAFPAVHLHITEYKTDEIINRLKNEQLDVGLLATPLHEQGILEQPLFYEQMLCYMDQQTASKFGNRVEINEMLKGRLWVLSEGNCFRNQTFNLCSLRQMEYEKQHFVYESGSLEALMNLVDKEGGSTIIPELALQSLSDARMDQVKFINEAHPVREISTVMRKKGVKVPLVNALREAIMASLPKQILRNDGERKVEIFLPSA